MCITQKLSDCVFLFATSTSKSQIPGFVSKTRRKSASRDAGATQERDSRAGHLSHAVLSFRSVFWQARLAAMVIARTPDGWQYRDNITGSIKNHFLAKMALDCCYVRILSGRKMTDQIGSKELGSFSSIEILSVAAITVILVMIAIPFPYASRNHWLPVSRTVSGGGDIAADTKSSGGGKTASVSYASQGSPFEVRTVGQREFCADMPGVVRFRTTGAPCKNGTLATNTSPQRLRTRP
jgi:hypothetical protein